MRPLIGITASIEPASWRVWRNVATAVLPHAYLCQVENAGGTGVILPPLPDPASEASAEVLERIDGLIVSGGVDVEPCRYGREPHATVQTPRPERDASELALVQSAVDRGLPLLGVCRGMQVMAVAAGGSLVQHLPDEIGSTEHAPATARYGATDVKVAPGSRLASVLGEQVQVSCYHHQGVAAHPGYEPVAWGSDGTLEAIEAPDARFRIGVQWHPEVGSDPRLFEALVATARG